MKLFMATVALASLIATPVSAAREHLNHDDYWNVAPVAGKCYANCRGRVSGLHRSFYRFGRRDVWGHWGAYYGPMIGY
jgi:hypothetical protein